MPDMEVLLAPGERPSLDAEPWGFTESFCYHCQCLTYRYSCLVTGSAPKAKSVTDWTTELNWTQKSWWRTPALFCYDPSQFYSFLRRAFKERSRTAQWETFSTHADPSWPQFVLQKTNPCLFAFLFLFVCDRFPFEIYLSEYISRR